MRRYKIDLVVKVEGRDG